MKLCNKINIKIKKEKAFSLLELMISLGIFAILIMMVTNLIILNLRVARKVKARTYVREESSFMLKILKKDIRNSDSISGAQNELLISIDDPISGTRSYRWSVQGNQIQRTEVNSMEITYKTPADMTVTKWDSLEMFQIYTFDENTVVVIRVRARDPNGMPEDQWIKKEVAVSTRNFQFN